MALPLALIAPAIRVGAIGAAAYTAFEKLGEYDSQAREFYEKMAPSDRPGRGGWNDSEDAFRHAYASARLALDAGETVSHAMGTLNEYKGMLLDKAGSAETGMDLWNNRVGREIARDLPSNATPQEIAEAVHRALERGQLVSDLKDPRAMEGAREVATEERLAQGAFNLFSNAKAFFSDLKVEDLAKGRELIKELPSDMVKAMADGIERVRGFDNESIHAMADKMLSRAIDATSIGADGLIRDSSAQAPHRERPAQDGLGRDSAAEGRSNGGGLEGVRIPGVDLGRLAMARDRELER